MKQHWPYLNHNLAARVVTLLAAIFLTGCTATPAAEPVVVAATSVAATAVAATAVAATAIPTSTPTSAAGSTLTPTATVTPTALPPTPTPWPSATPGTTPTAVPSPTPLPAATHTPIPPSNLAAGEGGGVQVYSTTITLPTYPIRDYLIEEIDPIYNMPVYYFQRQTYELAQPKPSPVDYLGVVLENDYLRLIFLPELGGRLYSAVVKTTDQEIFYHNKVVKPSRYGVLQPYEANWWLATGGMDWAYPTQEHGYRFGVPWQYTVTQSRTGATITLADTAPDRVGAEVQVTLPPGSALFTVKAKLTNATAETVPVQFWLNAALALAPDTMSLDTQFIVPSSKVVVHSHGAEGWDIPNEKESALWPEAGPSNLSHYRQWADYLGFFVPYLDAPFMGAYNPATNLGVVRLVEPGRVPGNKLFAFGPAFLDRSYTDDDSQYFEMWGGANTGFWPEDDVAVPPGGFLQWQESWWPVAGLGGLTWANENAAVFISQDSQDNNGYNLALAVTRPLNGTVTVLDGKRAVLTEPFQANPAAPLHWKFTAHGPVTVQVADQSGTMILAY